MCARCARHDVALSPLTALHEVDIITVVCVVVEIRHDDMWTARVVETTVVPEW